MNESPSILHTGGGTETTNASAQTILKLQRQVRDLHNENEWLKRQNYQIATLLSAAYRRLEMLGHSMIPPFDVTESVERLRELILKTSDENIVGGVGGILDPTDDVGGGSSVTDGTTKGSTPGAVTKSHSSTTAGRKFRQMPNGELKEHTGAVHCAQFSPDGKFLATGSSDKKCCLFGLHHSTQQQHSLLQQKSTTTFSGHDNTIYDISWARDSKNLLTASFDSSCRYWDVETGGKSKPLHTVQGESFVQCCCLLPSSPFIYFFADTQKNLMMVDIRTTSGIVQSWRHESRINSLCVHPASPTGNMLLTGDAKGSIHQWDLRLPSVGGTNSGGGGGNQQSGNSPSEQILALPSGSTTTAMGAPLSSAGDLPSSLLAAPRRGDATSAIATLTNPTSTSASMLRSPTRNSDSPFPTLTSGVENPPSVTRSSVGLFPSSSGAAGTLSRDLITTWSNDQSQCNIWHMNIISHADGSHRLMVVSDDSMVRIYDNLSSSSSGKTTSSTAGATNTTASSASQSSGVNRSSVGGGNNEKGGGGNTVGANMNTAILLSEMGPPSSSSGGALMMEALSGGGKLNSPSANMVGTTSSSTTTTTGTKSQGGGGSAATQYPPFTVRTLIHGLYTRSYPIRGHYRPGNPQKFTKTQLFDDDAMTSELPVVGQRSIADSDLVVVGGSDNAAMVFDVTDSESTRLVQQLVGHKDVVWGAVFHPVEPIIASFSGDATVKLWSTVSRRN